MASVSHLTCATSDHSPILLDYGNRTSERGERPFKYGLMWETHEGLKTILSEGWAREPPCSSVEQMRDKLRSLAGGLTRWSKDTFGSVRKEIKRLKQMLEELRGDPLRAGPSHVELKINEQLIEMYHREEIMWRQRSRIMVGCG